MTATAILWTLLALGIGMCLGIAVGHARATSAAFGRHRADLARSAERESQLREQLAHASAAAHTDDQLLEVFRSVSSQTMAEQSRQLLQLAETLTGRSNSPPSCVGRRRASPSSRSWASTHNASLSWSSSASENPLCSAQRFGTSAPPTSRFAQRLAAWPRR